MLISALAGMLIEYRITSDLAIAEFVMRRDERMRPAGGQPWNPRPA